MSNDAFDPTAPEGEISSHSQYLTPRDAKVILGAVVVFAVLCVPVYRFLLGYTESSRCTRNMQGINEALTLYATEHDGRYPPIDRAESLNSVVPSLGDSGHVYTWASDISGYMNVRASFLCPTAESTEAVVTEDPRSAGKTLLTTYGMYSAYGSCQTALVEKPDQTVIIAETSTNASHGTFDPSPMNSRAGEKLPDGFVIGWNDGNDLVSMASRQVTRLAFPNSSTGQFSMHSSARHGEKIHGLTSSGQLLDLSGASAEFGSLKQINPYWTLPPNSQTR